MSFTITKVSDKNFTHFDGFKNITLSNWEIVFDNTANTVILQMRNGAPFPKKEVLATDVIIKNGTGGTPETFTTTAQIRARLIELGYNALVTSGGGGGGDFIPLTGTEVGSPITGDLEFYNASDDVSVFIKFNASDGTYFFGTDEQYLLNSGFVLINGSFTSSLTSNADAFKVMSTDPDFKGLEGESDFTANLTDLCYPQKIYVDTPKLQTVTSSATVTPTSTNDIVTITAQATGLTLANPTGTFKEGQALMIRIKDNGTAQTITFGSNYRAIGVTLPTTTVISKILYFGIIYNSTDAKWDVLGINQQA